MKVFRKVACALFVVTLSFSSCVQGDLYDDFYDEDMPSWMMIGRRKFKNDNGDQSNTGSNGGSSGNVPIGGDTGGDLGGDTGGDQTGGDQTDGGQTDGDQTDWNQTDDTQNNVVYPGGGGNGTNDGGIIDLYPGYPTISDILNSPVVQSQMQTAWEMTLDDDRYDGYREYGFYIYWSATQGIYCGTIIPGKIYTPGKTAYAGIYEDGNNKPAYNYCAYFHTHPSLEHAGNGVERPTGPSKDDKKWGDKYGIPMLVYDYDTPILNNGYQKTYNAKVYTYPEDLNVKRWK